MLIINLFLHGTDHVLDSQLVFVLAANMVTQRVPHAA